MHQGGESIFNGLTDMFKSIIAVLFVTMLLAPESALARDLPFFQVGGVTVRLGDSATDVLNAFGEPDWQEIQKDVRVFRGRSLRVREVTVWWYAIDDGWGNPNNYGFFILEAEVVRIKQSGW
jgi:hypothetical protein